MDAAQTVALQRFPTPGCPEGVPIGWAHLGTTINASAGWLGFAGQPDTFVSCSIMFGLDVAWDWPKLCTVAEHERGHLDGFSDSLDPADVMSVYYVGPTSECQGPPSLTTPAPAVAAQTPDPAPTVLPVSRLKASRGRCRRPPTAPWRTNPNGCKVIHPGEVFTLPRHAEVAAWTPGYRQQLAQTGDSTPGCTRYVFLAPHGFEIGWSHCTRRIDGRGTRSVRIYWWISSSRP